MPEQGVDVNGELVPVDTVAAQLRIKIDGIVLNEKMGPGTLGALQNDGIHARVREAEALGLDVVRPSEPLQQPGYEEARSVTPLILKTDASRHDVYGREWFGPISFIVTSKSFDEALSIVENSIRRHGALTVLVYTTDDEKIKRAEDVLTSAGAPVAFNFDSVVWVNQSAAFSDFHGGGRTPAGNATFTDWSFVSVRFNVVGIRHQA